VQEKIEMRRRSFLLGVIFAGALWPVVSAGAPSPKLYWNRKFSVAFGRCNLDGSGVETAVGSSGGRIFVVYAINEKAGTDLLGGTLTRES